MSVSLAASSQRNVVVDWFLLPCVSSGEPLLPFYEDGSPAILDRLSRSMKKKVQTETIPLHLVNDPATVRISRRLTLPAQTTTNTDAADVIAIVTMTHRSHVHAYSTTKRQHNNSKHHLHHVSISACRVSISVQPPKNHSNEAPPLGNQRFTRIIGLHKQSVHVQRGQWSTSPQRQLQREPRRIRDLPVA